AGPRLSRRDRSRAAAAGCRAARPQYPARGWRPGAAPDGSDSGTCEACIRASVHKKEPPGLRPAAVEILLNRNLVADAGEVDPLPAPVYARADVDRDGYDVCRQEVVHGIQGRPAGRRRNEDVAELDVGAVQVGAVE